MHLLYGPLSESTINMRSSTSVMSIVFSNSVDISNGPKAQYWSGLGIYYFAAPQYKVDISICNVISTRSVGKRGGANFLFLNIGGVNITNITSSMANYLPPGEFEALYGTGFLFTYRVSDPPAHIRF